jgi:NTF2 fold immunity protein/Ankyrin repeats (3 copies)/Ankyrin repeats (many copies)
MSHHLRQAAAKGDVAKVHAHLLGGADVNAPHAFNGRTALTEAAIAGHTEVARLLLDHGADIDWRDRTVGLTPLGWASNCGHPALVELFLKRGADKNLPSNEFSISPLMWAAGEGNEAIVRLLLAGGANVNASASDGRTALSFARNNGHSHIAKLLTDAGGAEMAIPKPAKIAWPKVDESGDTCDHSTPEAVLRGFICAMNKWEAYAAILGMLPANRQNLLESMQAVIDRFCTMKKRPFGRAGSYQIPPEYDPNDEHLIEVNAVSRTRVELTTRCERPNEHEYLYVVMKKKDGWRLDSKLTRLIGGKWMKWTL